MCESNNNENDININIINNDKWNDIIIVILILINIININNINK